jgi:hypothetical protein
MPLWRIEDHNCGPVVSVSGDIIIGPGSDSRRYIFWEVTDLEWSPLNVHVN